jgi:hypothetical protein
VRSLSSRARTIRLFDAFAEMAALREKVEGGKSKVEQNDRVHDVIL